jgi:hypothetical protein
VLSEGRRGLGYQPGLANPWLTTHEDQLPPIVLDRRPDRLETLDLRPTPDEGCTTSHGRRR